MNIEFYDILGTLGVCLIVIAYLLLQLRKLDAKDLIYSALNALGAALILISLIYEFNFSAFLIEIFWLIISLIGIYYCLRQVEKTNTS